MSASEILKSRTEQDTNLLNINHSSKLGINNRRTMASGVSVRGIFGVIFTLCLVLIVPVSSVGNELKLVDNGYEGLVVSISDDIPQEQCKRIMHGLKVSTLLTTV